MKRPFRALFKLSAAARKGSLSTAVALQRLALAATPKSKRAKRKPKALAKPRPVARAAPRPAAGSFVDGHFTGPQGTMDYKLYTPLGSTRRTLPLVVMLHGCTQSAGDFAAGTGMNAVADELGFLVLYPQQSASANFARCWNWHRPGDQKRGAGEPALVAALTRHVIDLCQAHPDRVYVAGLSAGGAAAAIIGAAYPDLYGAVGVHSGLARGEIGTLSAAMSAMRHGVAPGVAGAKTSRPPPTIVFHGDQDNIVHPSNAGGFLLHLQRSSATPLLSRAEQGRSPGGRAYTRTLYRHGATDVRLEDWTVHGGGHGWSGGRAFASCTDPAGPDASRAIARFLLARRRPTPKGISRV
ncbi:PHB depolymerase family esterase (plasmid) [Brevundimonas staleyi]|uniref:Alpha/beta hydrolase family esterase n=1 Tax=Brevundimonas staleyi TaxID=74326 RepID=A0ABW0FT10_9CAUL